MTENVASSSANYYPADSDPGKCDDQLFQDGLRSILNDCQAQLGRSLEPPEILTITNQAKAFFTHHQTQTQDSILHRSTDDPLTIGSDSKSIEKVQEAEGKVNSNRESEKEQDSNQPRYPSSFHELVKLIAASSSSDQDGTSGKNDLISLLLNQHHTDLTGLKIIPDKLNDQQPSVPVLANQAGAGKKPWESQRDLDQRFDPNQIE